MTDTLATSFDTINIMSALQAAVFGTHTVTKFSATKAWLRFPLHNTIVSTGKLPDGLFDRHIFEPMLAKRLAAVIVAPQQPRTAHVGWFQGTPMHVVYAINEKRMRDEVSRVHHGRIKRAAGMFSLLCHEVRHEQQLAGVIQQLRTFTNTPDGAAKARAATDQRKRTTPLPSKETAWEVDASITAHLIEERCNSEPQSNWLDSAASLLLT